MSDLTIAEKLTRIGSNMPRIYDAAFDKGKIDGYREGSEDTRAEMQEQIDGIEAEIKKINEGGIGI